MTQGTGPQALVDHLLANWQASRTGRGDVPDVIRDSGGNGSNDPDDADGPGKVMVAEDRQKVRNQHSVFDLVHCYHPQAGVGIQDQGYDEVRDTETVQIDIETTDRNNPDDGTRSSCRDRLVGNRDDAAFPSDESPPYPGIKGEVKYILETQRRGFEEWDVLSVDVVNVHLGNSNANWSFSVDLEHLARKTVQ